MSIQCVIFDLGNVVVKWDPINILKTVFPDRDPAFLYYDMRDGWIEWNLGRIDRSELMKQYYFDLGMNAAELELLFTLVESTQEMLPGAYKLLEELHNKGIPLYSITDNTHEIIDYHRKNSGFLHFFKDIVVSAEVGVLKPDPAIYKIFLERNGLVAEECIFIDDLEQNIRGAEAVGITGLLFVDSYQARDALKAHGLLVGEDGEL